MLLKATLLSLALASQALAQNILSNTDHVAGIIPSAVAILGGTAPTTDQTCPTGGTGYDGIATCGAAGSFVPALIFPPYGTNVSQTEYTVNTATPVNHAPYAILSSSDSGYSLSAEQQSYTTITAGGFAYMWAYCGGGFAGDYPPIAMTNILPNYAPAGSSGCAYSQGIEFSMTSNYLGLNTGSPSATTASLSGVMAMMIQNHPTWTPGDRKAALRQTASNWATGYAVSATNGGVLGFGFGNINYTAATAVVDTAHIYLQGPGMQIVNHGYYAQVILYPFKTTRRAHEVIYSVSSAYAWPVKNEYTTSDITASGATLMYTSNGTDVTPQYSYVPSISGTITFVAFTTDGSGNYSRAEIYSDQTVVLQTLSSCTQ